jgi:hypothetical protein
MILKLVRDSYTKDTTLGKLYIDGLFFCHTLEDAARDYGVKVKGETAIPRGEYKVKLSKSSRFKRTMAMIYTEDNEYQLVNKGISFKGIRIHGGNTHKNTEGCILVAKRKLNDSTIQGTMEYDLTVKLTNVENITLIVE